jgi:hypothetical protein
LLLPPYARVGTLFCFRIRSGLDKSCICRLNTFILFMHMYSQIIIHTHLAFSCQLYIAKYYVLFRFPQQREGYHLVIRTHVLKRCTVARLDEQALSLFLVRPMRWIFSAPLSPSLPIPFASHHPRSPQNQVREVPPKYVARQVTQIEKKIRARYGK